MDQLPGKPLSLWRDTATTPGYPPLAAGEADAGGSRPDVVVIGGGIVGVTAAYLLKRAGMKVWLLENHVLGAGTTGRTTAKVTSLHGLVYHQIAASFGDEHAALYGQANQHALEWIASTVAGESIVCDFLRLPAFTFTAEDAEMRAIEDEVETATRLGLPASLVDGAALAGQLPIPAKGAIRFDSQAQFHPIKYLYALAAAIPGDGSAIYEHTRAMDIDAGRPCTVRTQRGDVKADYVIVATHSPFPQAGLYYARTHPESHPAIAYRVRGAVTAEGTTGPVTVSGMFLGMGGSPHSVRSARVDDTDYLVSDAPAYKTGHKEKVSEAFRALIGECEAAFPVSSVDYRWEAHDLVSSDRIPFVGRLTSSTPNVFVATGFRAWGMTNGTAAALMIAELVLGRTPAWMKVFDSTRKDIGQVGGMLAQVAETTRFLTVPRLLKKHEKVEDIAPGEARSAEIGGKNATVARDGKGGLHAVIPTCTHLGCVVTWNDEEESWDCPCHGSRYSADGQMLNGPTTRDLTRVETGAPPTGGG
jgi:glycine/D-amino acid oxidase-like deaminating enzyme/nitrite reductase/ring-hydroxylating ferredoxin subunit